MRLSIFLISVGIIVGLLWPAPTMAQSNQGRIEGFVTNLTTGSPPAEPLPTVEVLVDEWRVLRSGRDGEWNITGLPPGEYTVRLDLPPGYSPAEAPQTVTIWGDNTEVVNLGFYVGAAPGVTASAELTATGTLTDPAGRVLPLGGDTAVTETVPITDRIAALGESPAVVAQQTVSQVMPAMAGRGLPDAAATVEPAGQANKTPCLMLLTVILFGFVGVIAIAMIYPMSQRWLDLNIFGGSQ